MHEMWDWQGTSLWIKKLLLSRSPALRVPFKLFSIKSWVWLKAVTAADNLNKEWIAHEIFQLGIAHLIFLKILIWFVGDSVTYKNSTINTTLAYLVHIFHSKLNVHFTKILLEKVFCWHRDSNPRPSDLFLLALLRFASLLATTSPPLVASSLGDNHYRRHKQHSTSYQEGVHQLNLQQPVPPTYKLK